MPDGGYTYLMTNKPRGVLYVGMTADIAHRYWQHRNRHGSAFCRKWGLDRLVWYVHSPDILEAIAQEKRVKKWLREWKLALVEAENPHWRDLGLDLNR